MGQDIPFHARFCRRTPCPGTYGSHPGVPSVADGSSPAGFIPLSDFGVVADPIADEAIANYDVPDFTYNGRTFNQIGVDSNGYLVAGGGTSSDNECCTTNLPTASAPNNILAPVWTDMDGTGTPGISVRVLGDGVNNWVIVEWDVNIWGTSDRQHMQTWIGIDGPQDITYTYGVQPSGPAQPYAIGAENSEGVGQAFSGFPIGDQHDDLAPFLGHDDREVERHRHTVS